MIRPPPPCVDHLLRGDLRAEKRALEVDRQHLVVLVLRGIQHRGAGLDAGIVHHDVEAAEFRYRGLHQPLDFLDAADVGLHADGDAAQRCDFALELLGRLGMDHVVDDDIGAGLGQAECDRLADPAVPAGHDGDLALQ